MSTCFLRDATSFCIPSGSCSRWNLRNWKPKLSVSFSRPMPNAHVPAQADLHKFSRQSSHDDALPHTSARLLQPMDLACAACLGRRGRMPFCADLLGVRQHRNRNAWTTPRNRTRHLAIAALSPLLPRRARSGSSRPQFICSSCRSSAAQAFNIEREVCHPAPTSGTALGISEQPATPKR